MGNISNSMPTLTLNSVVTEVGGFPSSSRSSDADVMGAIRHFGFNSTGSAGDTNGQLVDISSNTALFSLLGTTYGGDGRTTFALPDLENVVAVGNGQGPGLTDRVQGTEIGSANITLTESTVASSLGGGGQSVSNLQESLPVVYAIKTEGIFPSRSGSAVNADPMATVRAFAFTEGNLPRDWVEANGQLLNISENTALFSLIGTTYGGDGRTTFALPDLRGRAVVGEGQAPGLADVRLGQKFGTEALTLSANQWPSSIGGGGQGFDNIQPSLGLNYIVALNGVYPSTDRLNVGRPEPFLGEVMMFAGNFAPSGTAFAHGQILSISSNTALFSLFGTRFGGDGRTTFALPDLRGRTIVDEAAGLPIGTKSGTQTSTISPADIADFAGFAADDSFAINENETVSGADVHDLNGALADSDPNSPLTVTELNGVSLVSGTSTTLSSGALVTLSQDGTLEYDPNGAFEYLTVGEITRDSFTYRNEFSNLATVRVTITGIDNNDIFDGNAIVGAMDGGLGTNGVTYEFAATGVVVSLADPTVNTGVAANDTYSNIQNLYGSLQNDELTGDGGDNVIAGLGGDDTIDGGAGSDTADYFDAAGPVTVRLDRGTATGDGVDTLISIENVIGSRFGDTIYGSRAANVTNTLDAGDGDDKVYGRNSLDIIYGGEGQDLLLGYAGNDTIYGGEGNDRIYGMFANDEIYGGTGADLVVGDAADDMLFGDDDNDRLLGGTGNDTLDGGNGADFMDGSSGNDVFKSSAGADRYVGRGDMDTFEFAPGNENDRIYGFEDNIDTIQISNSFGFADAADLITNHSRAVGNTLYLDLDRANGDHVQLIDWLLLNTANDLLDDITFG